jgi:hypothetical protein
MFEDHACDMVGPNAECKQCYEKKLTVEEFLKTLFVIANEIKEPVNSYWKR